MGAIAELKLNGIITHRYFIIFVYYFVYFSLSRRRSPTRTSTSLYKMPVIGKLQKSIQIISLKVQNWLFFFFCFVLQKCPMIYSWHMNLNMISIHKYLHKKQKYICSWHKEHGKRLKNHFNPGSYSDQHGTWAGTVWGDVTSACVPVTSILPTE